jgi:aryl-alcohol dehydrogenase-like predicted oxidoreductase
VDLYSLHFPDPGVPIEDTVGAMARLVDAGLVRHLGLSNVRLEHVLRALHAHRIAAIQIEWSLAHRPPKDLIGFCREQGIGIVAWWPLAGGLLAGSSLDLGPGDIRRSIARLGTIAGDPERERWRGVRDIAAQLDITPAQLALAWLLHQYEGCVPIPGSRSPRHIAENAAAADIALDPAAMERIDRALPSN